MGSIIQVIALLTGGLIILQIALYAYSKFIVNKKIQQDDFAELESIYGSDNKKEENTNYGKFHGVLKRESIMDFLSFDAVRDGMIVRNGGKEYVMVLECSGVNFDLRSENEKLAIEEGFIQFLNALKFPVQLYVQTRKVDFGDVLETYHNRINGFKNDIEKIEEEITDAEKLGDRKRAEMLVYERNRRENLYDYAVDSIQYTEQLSSKGDVLQRKTYVVISYFTDELGQKVEDYSNEEKEMLVFNELVTRCNNLNGALQASRVSSRLLNSEELVELLFNAFNRDEMENIKLSSFFNSEYQSSLYTKSEDYIEKEKRLIKKEINKEALELATSSIIKADRLRKREILNMKIQKNNNVKKKANSLIDDKKDVLIPETYKKAKEIVKDTELKEDEEVLKSLEKDPELKRQYEATKNLEKEGLQNIQEKPEEEVSLEEKEQIRKEDFMNKEFSKEIEEIKNSDNNISE